jgi:hypothetical protein
MADTPKEADSAPEKATVTLEGTVEKIIPAMGTHVAEKAQIAVHGGEELYKEIRVENELLDADGKPVALKVGAAVEVTIAAPPEATAPKK